MWVHVHAGNNVGCIPGMRIYNRLLNLYCKCGYLVDAHKVLDQMTGRDVSSSAAASIRTVRSVTVPVAPSFSSAERAAKRKEFYKKLEEKHKALEAEKKEYEARMKEEKAAAIKQLRQNMVVKAKPVPSFYREGSPLKVEPKKLVLGGPYLPEIESILCAKASSMGSPVVSASDSGNKSVIRGISDVCGKICQTCDIVLEVKSDLKLSTQLLNVNLRMLGPHQLQNAATATYAALCLRHQVIGNPEGIWMPAVFVSNEAVETLMKHARGEDDECCIISSLTEISSEDNPLCLSSMPN